MGRPSQGKMRLGSLGLGQRQALEGMEGESQSGAILILAQLAQQFTDISTEAPGQLCL